MLTNPLFIAYVVLIIAAMVVSVIAAKKSGYLRFDVGLGEGSVVVP